MSNPDIRSIAESKLKIAFEALYPLCFETNPSPLPEPEDLSLVNGAQPAGKKKKKKKAKKRKIIPTPMEIKSQVPSTMSKGHVICPSALEAAARLQSLNFPIFKDTEDRTQTPQFIIASVLNLLLTF